MPIYQAQLKRTAFRSFAPGAGVYRGAPPRPPRPPPCAPPPPWAGAAAGACAKVEDGVLIVRATAIATLVPKIFRRAGISSPFLLGIPTVAEGWQPRPVYFTLASPAKAEATPALHHLPIAPPRDVRRAARHTAPWTLDYIGCGRQDRRPLGERSQKVSPVDNSRDAAMMPSIGVDPPSLVTAWPRVWAVRLCHRGQIPTTEASTGWLRLPDW
jgi:hypothetical protein